MKYHDVELINNQDKQHFELWIDGKRSFLQYQVDGNTFFLLHTEVPAEQSGKGIAGALVEKALCYIEENNYGLVAHCEYVQSYLQRHPEWKRLEAG